MASTRVLEIPLIIAGNCRYPGSSDDAVHVLRYEDGRTLRVPVMTREDLQSIEDSRREVGPRLARLNNYELTIFLEEVGKRWLTRTGEGRQLVDAYTAEFNGLPPAMIEMDCAEIGTFLTERSYTYEAIEAEFGTDRFMDEWQPIQMCFRKAFPRGLVLHYLVGNIPVAALYSLVRGIITRNMNLAKWPTRDPVTTVGFLQTFAEVDPTHPVTRSLSAAYWPHDAEIGDACLARADAVCVWGGGSAVEVIKRRVPVGVPISEYGPRWSASVIDLEACDVERAAARLVHDVSLYDQEACLNSQRAFVRGDVDSLVRSLGHYQERFSARFPLQSFSRDAMAHRSMSLLEARYLGWSTETGRDWAAVVVEDPAQVTTHPLCRTLYIHPIRDVGETVSYLDSRSQTLGVYPWSLTSTWRDRWAWAGVDRMVELGAACMPREGFTHDGTTGLHQLVRIVAVERDLMDRSRLSHVKDPVEWERSWFGLDAGTPGERG